MAELVSAAFVSSLFTRGLAVLFSEFDSPYPHLLFCTIILIFFIFFLLPNPCCVDFSQPFKASLV